jgi:hypothetical protein
VRRTRWIPIVILGIFLAVAGAVIFSRGFLGSNGHERARPSRTSVPPEAKKALAPTGEAAVGPSPSTGSAAEGRAELREILGKMKTSLGDEDRARLRQAITGSRPPRKGLTEAHGYPKDLRDLINAFAAYYDDDLRDISSEDSLLRRVARRGDEVLDPLIALLETDYGASDSVASAVGTVLNMMARTENADVIVRAFETHPELEIAPTIERLEILERVKPAVSRLLKSRTRRWLPSETIELIVGMRLRELDPDLLWYMENGPNPGMVAKILVSLHYEEPPLEGLDPAVLRAYERFRQQKDWWQVVMLGEAALSLGQPLPFPELISLASNQREDVEPEVHDDAFRILEDYVSLDEMGENRLIWLRRNWSILRFDANLRRFIVPEAR